MATVAQQLAALTDHLAELTEQVRQLAVREAVTDTFWSAGYAAGAEHERAALLGKAHETSTVVKPSRPGHLKSV